MLSTKCEIDTRYGIRPCEDDEHIRARFWEGFEAKRREMGHVVPDTTSLTDLFRRRYAWGEY